MLHLHQTALSASCLPQNKSEQSLRCPHLLRYVCKLKPWPTRALCSLTASAHHLLQVNSTFIQSEQATSGNAGSLSVLMSSNSSLYRNNTPPLRPNVGILFETKAFKDVSTEVSAQIMQLCCFSFPSCMQPLVLTLLGLLPQKGSASFKCWLYTTLIILQIRIITGGYVSLLLYFGLTEE